jgi:hypothetical protein
MESREFASLLDCSLGWQKGYAVMLHAFFDASGSGNDGTMAVAGVAFGEDQAKKADREWRILWDDTICHWADLSYPCGDFEDWPKEKTRQFCEDSIAIIRKYASFAVVVSCDIAEAIGMFPQNVQPYEESWLSAVSSPYSACFHMAMQSLGGMVRKEGKDARIAYFIEQGDSDQKYLRRFMRAAENNADAMKDYCHVSHTIIEKRDARLLETADCLAWEWAAHQRREKKQQPMRPSLRYLLWELDGRRRGFQSFKAHLPTEELREAYDRIERFREVMRAGMAAGGVPVPWV